MAFVCESRDCVLIAVSESVYISCEGKIIDKLGSYSTDSKPSEEANGDTPDVQHDEHKVQVLCCCVDVDLEYFVLCNNKRQLRVWRISDCTLVSNRHLDKQASAICIVPNTSRKVVLVADRAGNVTQFTLPSCDDEKVILGHISMLLDVVVSRANDYVVTCDRDEKLRVSHFPDAYNIRSYCLGHTEFVKSASFFTVADADREWLASVSGDGTLMLWDHLTGALLNTVDIVLPEDCLVITKDNDEKRNALSEETAMPDSQSPRKLIATNSGELVVVYERSRAVSLHVAKLLANANVPLSVTSVVCNLTGEGETTAPAVSEVLDCSFSEQSGNLMALIRTEKTPCILSLRIDVKIPSLLVLAKLTIGTDVAEAISEAKFELPLLRKNASVGNVDEYIRRKEERIEVQAKKFKSI